MPDTTVKFFRSIMSGAPVLSGTAGALIAILDACLVNGFGSVTLDSLVVASNVATGTVSGGHNLAMVGTVGPVVRIEGATPAGLNCDWRVTVTSSTAFTFATTGITDQTASGTITAKRAPAGFEKAFSGTNLAAYRSLDVQGTRLYCRIDDTGTTQARQRGYETMSDVNTGTGPFPTDVKISGGMHIYKSNSGTTSNRPWVLYSDGRLIYFSCDSQNTGNWLGGFVFGDINSYKSADAYHSISIGAPTTSYSLELYQINSASSSCIARNYTQTGGSVDAWRYSHRKQAYLGTDGAEYPSPIDNSIHLWPVECWESAGARGMMPGLWSPVHAAGSIPHGTIITEGLPQLPGRTVITNQLSSYMFAVDITGPWRSA